VTDDELLEGLYKEGEERIFIIKILDYDLAKKNLTFCEDNGLGFIVHGISNKTPDERVEVKRKEMKEILQKHNDELKSELYRLIGNGII